MAVNREPRAFTHRQPGDLNQLRISHWISLCTTTAHGTHLGWGQFMTTKRSISSGWRCATRLKRGQVEGARWEAGKEGRVGEGREGGEGKRGNWMGEEGRGEGYTVVSACTGEYNSKLYIVTVSIEQYISQTLLVSPSKYCQAVSVLFTLPTFAVTIID